MHALTKTVASVRSFGYESLLAAFFCLCILYSDYSSIAERFHICLNKVFVKSHRSITQSNPVTSYIVVTIIAVYISFQG